MKKGFLILCMMIALTLSSAFAFADTVPVKNVEEAQKSFDTDKSFVNKPKDFVLSTLSDTVVVSGVVKENDKLTITLMKRVKDEYVPYGEPIELTIGALGAFTKELSLKDTKSDAPKEVEVVKETLVVLELKRGKNTATDYRLIKFSDEKEVKETLKAVTAPRIVAPVAKN